MEAGVQDQPIGGREPADPGRRALAGTLAAVLAASPLSVGRSLAAIPMPDAERSGRMKQVRAGVLDVAYLESGPADGPPVVLLHGFPYDAHAYAVAAERLAAAGRRVVVPFLRGYGPTRFVDADTPRVGQQAALGSDLLALLDALRIPRATLAGYDWGGRAACVVAALWPERVSGLVSCGTGYNIQNAETAAQPMSPESERHHWYWFYLNSERGQAALAQDRAGFCRFLWSTFSPTWRFDDASYARTAPSFDNADFVPVVLHSYRYRIGAVPGDPALDPMERRLAAEPRITVPTIVLEGAEDGVDPPAEPKTVAARFTALRRQTPLQGIGHNLPQEAPEAFAEAVLDVGT